MSTPISGLILTQNSEKTLRRCLDSLKDLDEVVVIDGGSIDQTKEIATSYSNVSFYENPWPGFIAQREFSRQKARHQWCLMLDSDEMIEPEALNECKEIIKKTKPLPMYAIVRTEYFNGVAIEYGHGKSDYQERLFLKDRVEYYGGTHHLHKIDGLKAPKNKELIGYLPSHLRIQHDPHYGVFEWLRKVPRFSLTIANEKCEKKRIGLLQLALCFPLNFFKIYMKSWRAGKEGLIISLQTAIVRTLIKLRIYEMQTYQLKKEDFNVNNLG